jgi:hypothetical protein
MIEGERDSLIEDNRKVCPGAGGKYFPGRKGFY